MNVIIRLYGFSKFLLRRGQGKALQTEDAIVLRQTILKRLVPCCKKRRCPLNSLLVHASNNEIEYAGTKALPAVCLVEITLTQVPETAEISKESKTLSMIAGAIVTSLGDYSDAFPSGSETITAHISANEFVVDLSWPPLKKGQNVRRVAE